MKNIKQSSIKILIILLSIFMFWGCPTTPPKAEKESVLKPEITLKVASLNLANLNKRIERKNIVELARILKREQVEVFTAQGISRYPGVTTRVDFVNEFTGQTEWRNVFGEMLNVSGRQTGNAIFSSYPIISHYNQTYDDIKSADFEAALQATIDAGVRSIVVVSAQLPSKATANEQAQCIKLIAALNPDEVNPLTIVAGNLPSSETIRAASSFAEVPLQGSTKSTSPKVWYSASKGLQLLTSRTVDTELGTLVIAQWGLFRQK